MGPPARAAATATFLLLLALSVQNRAGLASPSFSGMPQGGWRIDIVNTEVDPLISPSGLVLDSGGRPHATFEDWDDATGTNTAYSYRSTLGWSPPLVIAASSYNPRIAVDSNDVIHFAWSSTAYGSESGTYYAVLTGTTLVTEELDPGAAWQGSIGLALDGADVPHAVFQSGSCGLYYAVRNQVSGGWSKELIESGCGTGLWNDLDVDSQGRIVVAYRFGGSGLRYAVRAPDGTWAKETVDPSCGIQISLALDSKDQPHLSCQQSGVGLRYMNRIGTSWEKETVDPNSVLALQVGRGGTSLEIDSQDRVHIAYGTFRDAFGGDTGRPGGLRYAIQLLDGSWNIQIVDQIGQWVGTGPSLQLDAYDAPRILYRLEALHDDSDGIPGPNGADIRYAEPIIATALGMVG